MRPIGRGDGRLRRGPSEFAKGTVAFRRRGNWRSGLMIRVNRPSLPGHSPVDCGYRWNHGPRSGTQDLRGRLEPKVVSIARCISPTSLAKVRRETSRGKYPTRKGRLAWIGPVERNVVGEKHACSKKPSRSRDGVITAQSSGSSLSGPKWRLSG
jgi:hypothetical protein